jgi:hypothetical protein
MSETLIQFRLPCPSCDAPVYVVADPDRHRSRWVCTNCQTVGEGAFLVELPTPDPARPVAQA